MQKEFSKYIMIIIKIIFALTQLIHYLQLSKNWSII